jgi:hypothetical protein
MLTRSLTLVEDVVYKLANCAMSNATVPRRDTANGPEVVRNNRSSGEGLFEENVSYFNDLSERIC